MLGRILALLVLTSSVHAKSATSDKLFYVDGESGEVTLVSLDGSAENCQLPPYFYPDEQDKAPAYLNYLDSIQKVVACGCWQPAADPSLCFTYDGFTWEQMAPMEQDICYFGHANEIVDEGWWLAGRPITDGGPNMACDGDAGWVSQVFNGTDWVQGGPATPPENIAGSEACNVQLNSTHTLYTGGYESWTEAWIYSWPDQLWTRTGDLLEGRYGHGCVAIEGGALIVGGRNVDIIDIIDTVERYSADTGLWTAEPPLDNNDGGNGDAPLLFPYGDTVLGLLWDSKQVWTRSEDGSWNAIPGVSLPELFAGYPFDKAVLVPDIISGCV